MGQNNFRSFFSFIILLSELRGIDKESRIFNIPQFDQKHASKFQPKKQNNFQLKALGILWFPFFLMKLQFRETFFYSIKMNLSL